MDERIFDGSKSSTGILANLAAPQGREQFVKTWS